MNSPTTNAPAQVLPETERIIHGPVRGTVHQHLLNSGFIEERTVDTRGALVVVTAAGRKALRNRS